MSPAEEGLQPGASLVWRVKGRSRSTTLSSPSPSPEATPGPASVVPAGKVQRSPRPRPEGGANKRSFLHGCPRQLDRSPRGRGQSRGL